MSSKRDMKALNNDTESWVDLTADHTRWRSTLNQHLKTKEEKLMSTATDKRVHRKERNNSNQPATSHNCGIDSHTLIGLFSYKRCCSMQPCRQQYTRKFYSWSTLTARGLLELQMSLDMGFM